MEGASHSMESTPLLTELLSQDPVQHRTIRKITIEPAIFLYFLYFSGSMSLTSQFVNHQLESKDNGLRSSVSCTANNAQSEASIWLMYMNIAFTVPSFFSTIILGGYSDHAGRKIALVSPLIGATVVMLVFIFIYFFDLHVGFLIIASLIDGIGGGACSVLMSCFSYVSDITDSEHRSTRIVAIEFCLGIAIIISVLGTGFIINYLGFLWTFVVLLGVVLLTLTYVVFLLPETILQSSEREAFQLFQTSHFTRLLALFRRDVDDNVTQRKQKLSLLVCLVTVFFVSSIELSRGDVMTLFMIAPPLCFTSVWIGYYFAWAYLIMNMGMILATHLLAKRFGDLKLVVVGLMSGVGYMVTFGSATKILVLFAAPVVGCLSSLPIALVRSFSSKIVEPSALGSMFAAIAWFQTLGSLVGHVIQNNIMAATAGFMECLVFFVDAGLLGITVILFVCFIVWLKRQRPSGDGPTVQSVDDYSVLIN